MPGVDEEMAQPQPAAGLFAFFGNRQAPVTMATIVPPRLDRRDREGMTIGLMHPTGGSRWPAWPRGGVDTRALDGAPGPRGRGPPVRTRPDDAGADAAAWSVEAGTALCRVETTGAWRAVVYLP